MRDSNNYETKQDIFNLLFVFIHMITILSVYCLQYKSFYTYLFLKKKNMTYGCMLINTS